MGKDLEDRLKKVSLRSINSTIKFIEDKLNEYSKRPDALSYRIYAFQNYLLELRVYKDKVEKLLNCHHYRKRSS